MNTTIVKTVHFTANKETVWSFLTDKDKLGEWFHPAEDNLSPNSEYALLSKDDEGNDKKLVWGKIETFKPYTELAYTLTISPLGGVFTTVSWKLEDAGSGTKLTMEHTGLPVDGDALMLVTQLDIGWDKHFASLRENVAG